MNLKVETRARMFLLEWKVDVTRRLEMRKRTRQSPIFLRAKSSVLLLLRFVN
jgi:hypothetical protein